MVSLRPSSRMSSQASAPISRTLTTSSGSPGVSAISQGCSLIWYSAAADTEKTKTSAGARSARGAKSGALKAAVQATCGDYNHVGDKWTYAYYVNGTKVTDGKSFTFNVGDEVAFKAVITEEDSTPDVGENTVTRVITEKDLQEGFKQRFTVSVTENGGRYNGSTARFTVTFSFTK